LRREKRKERGIAEGRGRRGGREAHGEREYLEIGDKGGGRGGEGGERERERERER
jgi:hypothetical protein